MAYHSPVVHGIVIVIRVVIGFLEAVLPLFDSSPITKNVKVLLCQ